MVRETRHLWVGNLPENVREEKIIEHFKRWVEAHGRWTCVCLFSWCKGKVHGQHLSPLCHTFFFVKSGWSRRSFLPGVASTVCQTVLFFSSSSALRDHQRCAAFSSVIRHSRPLSGHMFRRFISYGGRGAVRGATNLQVRFSKPHLASRWPFGFSSEPQPSTWQPERETHYFPP